jgi:hypothetical protein
MTQRIKVGEDERVPVKLSASQRDLILNHTFVGADVTEPLVAAPLVGTKILVRYTLSDIEDLMGYVAAEANHSEDPKLRRKLEQLYDYLHTFDDRYEDELSAPRS